MDQLNNSMVVEKLEKLKKIVKSKDSVAVAFSGGIDSSLLAKVVYDELQSKSIAVTVDSDVFTEKGLKFSQKIAQEIGIKHIIVTHSKFDDPLFAENHKDRCYNCKGHEIDLVAKEANLHDIKTIAYGINTSDRSEHRPGIKAITEKGAWFPLEKAGIGKSIIPQLAKALGLSNYNMPSTTCLASRIPYGTLIDKKKLLQIEEAEDFINNFNIHSLRVRCHGNLARIEVAASEMDIILLNKNSIVAKLKKLGFKYVALDLQGYRSGSMDEVL